MALSSDMMDSNDSDNDKPYNDSYSNDEMDSLLNINEKINLLKAGNTASLLGDIFNNVNLEDLFNGNLYPPKYICKAIKNFNVNKFTCKKYAKSTKGLIRWTEN